MSGDDSSLGLRAPARETVFRHFPLASPSGALYIERMFFLRRCINQSVHYLRLYRSLYSNKWELEECRGREKERREETEVLGRGRVGRRDGASVVTPHSPIMASAG